MIPAERVTQAQNAIDGLTALANATTKAGDSNITDAVSTLIDGYNKGGGGIEHPKLRMMLWKCPHNNWLNSAANGIIFPNIHVGDYANVGVFCLDYVWQQTLARNALIFGTGSNWGDTMRLQYISSGTAGHGYTTDSLIPHNVDGGINIYAGSGVAGIKDKTYLVVVVGDIIDL